jgi:pimeloyl-ACP methyl ester carboxylesterase
MKARFPKQAFNMQAFNAFALRFRRCQAIQAAARRSLNRNAQAMTDAEAETFLSVGEGSEARRLAMRLQPGSTPAIIWVGGFRSDMTSTKAAALVEWGHANKRAVIRFDYSGHGASSGEFAEGTISRWLDDTIAVLESHGGAAPVLVGSSMGGWIALLAAMRLKAAGSPAFPSSLVLIAPAVDFTEALIWAQMPEVTRQEIISKGQWLRENQYGPPYPITRELIEDGRKHLLFGRPIAIGCPIHILQGMEDPDVPYAHALKLIEHLPLETVTLTTVKDGDHRLSRPEDIALLMRIVGGVTKH